MTATLIEGRAIARDIREKVKEGIASLAPFRPKLVSVLVGDDEASAVYIRNQSRACAGVGIEFERLDLPSDTEQDRLLAELRRLGEAEDVTAVIVQRPLPPHIDQRMITASIPIDKDVEGLNPANLGFVVLGEPRLAPCTALAAVRCAQATGVPFRGKHAVVIGHSEIVGKPIAFLMLNHFTTTTICHVATQDLASHVKEADIVFVAVGKPGLIHGSMLKPGAIVIDVGTRQIPKLGEDGQPLLDDMGRPLMKLAGDVDFESAQPVASFLTPVPGGVGPVTVATLLHNVYLASRHKLGKSIDIDEFAP